MASINPMSFAVDAAQYAPVVAAAISEADNSRDFLTAAKKGTDI